MYGVKHVLSRWQLEYSWKNSKRLVAFEVSVSIKIIVHPSLASDLYVEIGPGNPRDRYAVAVCTVGDKIVEYLPRNISTMCSILIWHGEIIYCTVLGGRQYSRDLPKG